MIERRDGTRLPEQPRAVFRIVSQSPREDLQCDIAFEFRVPGAIDDPHAARAELRHNRVRSELTSEERGFGSVG